LGRGALVRALKSQHSNRHALSDFGAAAVQQRYQQHDEDRLCRRKATASILRGQAPDDMLGFAGVVGCRDAFRVLAARKQAESQRLDLIHDFRLAARGPVTAAFPIPPPGDARQQARSDSLS
jgi:hypothetical protein